MTIITIDNQELIVLQLGKLIKHIDKKGEEDWIAEPCNLILCKDKEGNKLELEITVVKYWCKPYKFVTDGTTQEESEREEPIRVDPLAITWTLDSLLNHCCTRTGITAEELCTKTKKRTVTAVRGLYCYLACKLTNNNLTSIGEKICQPHDMVIYYRNTVKGYVESGDRRTKELLDQLQLNFDDSKLCLDKLNK